ncbi:hypothetical protein ACEZ3G_09985 [Maribacter algicola]|uniref:Uncharacterized protein n=1 Tax=Meishania litoralis TaxID=3434685 RepID=A0ACC7LL85_9FLAO
MNVVSKASFPAPLFARFWSNFRYFFRPVLSILSIVGDRREVHHLVRLCEPYGIYLPQAHEPGPRAEHGNALTDKFQNDSCPISLYFRKIRRTAFSPLDGGNLKKRP